MAGQIKMRRSAVTLSYREGKPTVYKLRQLIFPGIKHKQLVKYISNSAHIPESTVEAAIAGIIEAIVYFVVNGHRVVFPRFGGFYMGVKAKTANTAEECTISDTLTACRLLFAPVSELRELIMDTGTQIMGTGQYLTPEPEGD